MPALGRAFRAYICSNLVVAMRTESASRSLFYLTTFLALGLLFLTFTPSHDANAQNISYCERYSDVRPNAHSESPREKCQCAIDSSYCITPNAGSPPGSGGSNVSTCSKQGKVPVPIGTNMRKCMSCWALASAAVGGSTSAIDFINKEGFTIQLKAI